VKQEAEPEPEKEEEEEDEEEQQPKGKTKKVKANMLPDFVELRPGHKKWPLVALILEEDEKPEEERELSILQALETNTWNREQVGYYRSNPEYYEIALRMEQRQRDKEIHRAVLKKQDKLPANVPNAQAELLAAMVNSIERTSAEQEYFVANPHAKKQCCTRFKNCQDIALKDRAAAAPTRQKARRLANAYMSIEGKSKDQYVKSAEVAAGILARELYEGKDTVKQAQKKVTNLSKKRNTESKPKKRKSKPKREEGQEQEEEDDQEQESGSAGESDEQRPQEEQAEDSDMVSSMSAY
jgi:hypothetical protein